VSVKTAKEKGWDVEGMMRSGEAVAMHIWERDNAIHSSAMPNDTAQWKIN